jgi:REP element-mobilizing transposase RayT
MAKKKRIWYPGATYHIMCRGNRRSDLFRDEEDYQVFVTILDQAKEKYEYILYSYCLMTNHIHLQLQTEQDEIWKIMRLINILYAKYFNGKYNFIGHLFQGRYRSELIEEDSYNLATSRYIHLNPVAAAMVEVPLDYKWSSYDIYLGQRKSDLIDDREILSYFKNNSRALYKKYVESKLINNKMDKQIKQKMEVV